MPNTAVLPARPVASYSHHLHERAGDALLAASTLGVEEVIETIAGADLRGRGGAWFPTATKLATTRRFASSIVAPSLVVNAAEGEPGSFKDRWLLRQDPYSVIEGAVIVARVIGADVIVFALKERFTQEIERIREAGDDVMSLARPPFPAIEILKGPDRYLFGEESALLEVAAGRPPFPRLSPPWRHGALDLDGRGEPATTDLAAEGTDGRQPPPALVQNVETLARISHLVRNTDEAGVSAGARTAVPTFLSTVSGDVETALVAEYPIGVSLRDVIDAAGGGDVGVVLNGVSFPMIPATHLDLPMLPHPEPGAGLPIGAGAIQVFSPEHDPRAIAAGAARFLSTESCGQCDPCKTDGLAIRTLLGDALGTEQASVDRVDELVARAERVTDGARCGLARQQQDLVESLLAYFPSSLLPSAMTAAGPPAHIGPLSDIVDGRAIHDRATVQPDWTQSESWGGSYPAESTNVGRGTTS